MTSISSSFATVSRRQYVSAGVFNNNFFTYRTFLDANLRTRGSLTTATSAGNCPAGRILRETGKKLTGVTHPDLQDPTTSTVYTFLVGVYDVTSGVNGFIDPNCPLFAPFTTDKTYQDNTTAEAIDASTGLQEVGPPVFTKGTVTSTKVFISPNTAGGAGPLSTGTALAPLTTSAGKANLLNGNQTIYTTTCNIDSLVLVSVNNGGGGGARISVVPTNGSFQVVTDLGAGNTANFNWIVIN